VDVTWGQVLAWRMRRQLLDAPGALAAADVVRRLAGVQAQVASAAELAVATRRTEPESAAVERALADGDLLRTWAMRGTLHLLPPETAGAFLALVGAARPWEKGSWQRAFGLSPAEVTTLGEAVTEALDSRVLTREELVTEAVDRTGAPHIAEQLRSGWGAVLKPLAWQGLLCHGPPQGNRVTFVRPDKLPGWRGVPEPGEAAATVIPAYLSAYGPATPATFDAWLTRGTSRKAALRGWFEGLGDALVEVDVEGTRAYLRAVDADELADTSPTATVRLLPGFDQYVLGPGTGAAEIVDPARRPMVSKAAGWIAPVVVAAGRVAGVWEVSGEQLAVTLFREAGRVDAAALEAETARVAAFLGQDLALSVATG
jgi:Winged helix DNA-binding domain